MNPVTNRVVVVGCGDRLASDGAAGLEVADQLRRTPGHVCEIRDIQSCSPNFLAELPPGAMVIFVDAVRSGSRPGTIHWMRLKSPALAAQTLQFGASHTRGLRPEIENLLRVTEPGPQMYLIGIEIEKWDPGFGITSSVHAAVLEVVRELSKLNEKGQPKLPLFRDI